MPVPVPGRFDEITTAWFAAALAEGGRLAADVAEIAVEPMAPDAGLLGDLALVHATFADDRPPRSFVLKLPAANPTSRQIGDMLRAYEREVAFYRHIAPRATGTQLAACFYAGQDRAARRWALVLEAVEADEVDFVGGATIGQAHAAVDALADWHGDWWQSPDPHRWMPGFDTTGVGGLQPLWTQNLPVFVERYADVLPGESAAWVLRFAPTLGDWSTAAAAEPLTMVHSDCRIDNLLFRGEQVTIIDWQTAMRAPAAMDLTCFIATSLDVELRRASEDALIDRYLARLERRGASVDGVWFRRSYDQNLLWWMGQFGNNLAHLEPDDPSAAANLRLMVERVYTAGLDHRVDRLL